MAHELGFFRHRQDCHGKQHEQATRIARLPSPYRQSMHGEDRKIINQPIQELVQAVHVGHVRPIDILRSYGKAAILAHQKTNCLTEVMLEEAEACAETRTDNKGAIPYVKTNVPITLLSFESTNDVWGRTANPHNSKFSPGGSTGGEAALLALGGSRVGVGSDVAGSVRVPAHFSGVYALRCSVGRWPKSGSTTSTPGQEGVPSVYSPMARTLEDLIYFTRSILEMKPWRYDHGVIPLGWREDHVTSVKETKRFRVGVMRDDGIVPPSPACARALEQVVSALRAEGHEVLDDLHPPSPYQGLLIGSQLLTADGCQTSQSFMRINEWNDPGVAEMCRYANLPRPIRYLYYLWARYVRRDQIWADLLRGFGRKTVAEQWQLVAQRETYRAEWHHWWHTETKLDFLLTVPYPTPAVPQDGMKQGFSACGYTFLFNVLDYTAGVLPVTHVDRIKDEIPTKSSPITAPTTSPPTTPSANKTQILEPEEKHNNAIANSVLSLYDADEMHGLPVGVQVVGARLEEEKVLSFMARVEQALARSGDAFEALEE